MKRLLFLIILFCSPALAQTSAVTNFCNAGAQQAVTTGLRSTNYLQGVIPYCTVTVYNTGTVNLATIYSNAGSTPLTNPFKASQTGQWTFWGSTSACFDIQFTGGVIPNTYQTPVTLTDVCPGGGGGGGSGTTLTGPVTGTGTGVIATTITPTGVSPGTYILGGGVAISVNAAGQLISAGSQFSANFVCSQCGTYETGYSAITSASGTISYANPSVPTSASVTDGTNTDTLSTPFTTWALNHTYTTNTCFTLTAVGGGQTLTPQQCLAFVSRSYGGTGTGGSATGATAAGTSAVLVGASGTLTNGGLGNACAGQVYTLTTSGTQYIYLLLPCNVGNPGGGSFTIPGPAVFPMNAPTSFTYTGQYGGTWTGYLYRSVNPYVNGTTYVITVGS